MLDLLIFSYNLHGDFFLQHLMLFDSISVTLRLSYNWAASLGYPYQLYKLRSIFGFVERSLIRAILVFSFWLIAGFRLFFS